MTGGRHADVVSVGTGVVGTSIADALAGEGLRVTVLDGMASVAARLNQQRSNVDTATAGQPVMRATPAKSPGVGGVFFYDDDSVACALSTVSRRATKRDTAPVRDPEWRAADHHAN